MAAQKKPILPRGLRSKIKDMIKQNIENDQILEHVRSEAAPYVTSDKQLAFCIKGIKAALTKETNPPTRHKKGG